MTNKNIAIKKVKGFSSAYPNVCNLKLFPNIDGTWITIQDDVGTSMTIKLSDLESVISIIKAECLREVEKLQPVKQEIVTEFADRCRECGKTRMGHCKDEE